MDTYRRQGPTHAHRKERKETVGYIMRCLPHQILKSGPEDTRIRAVRIARGMEMGRFYSLSIASSGVLTPLLE